MSLTAVILRNQRSKNRQQMPKCNNISSAVNSDQDQQGQQEQQQQLKMLKAMKLASQDDHRYYASVDKTVVQFPPAAIKANAVALNPNDLQNQSNPSRPFSLASSSHLSIRSDYEEGSLEDEEVLLRNNINCTIINK